MDGKICSMFFLFAILFQLHFKPTFSTSAAREMDEIIVSNSKVDLNLHSPTAGGGQQDIVGSTLPVSPYFIQMASDDSSRVQVMIKIIQGFGWHEVVVLRQDTVFYKRFALSLEDAFLGAKIKIISTVSLSVSAKDLEIAEKLDKLKAMQTRVFLVYMVPLLRSRVLILAKTAGIMNEGYTWLIMDGVSDTSKSFQFNNLDSGEVVLPRRDVPPRSNGRTHFKSECEKLSSWIKSEKATSGDTPVKWKACVPVKDGFTEFVHVDKKKCKLISGFSTEVFCAALQIFPYKVEPKFVPLTDHNCEVTQNYSDILKHVDQSCDAVVGDTTILSSRTSYVEFALPYMSSEVYMLLLAKRGGTHKSIWTFVKPLSWELWLTMGVTCMLAGAAFQFLEHRVNSELNAPWHQQLFMLFWFPFSALIFPEVTGSMANPWSKVVMVIWLCMAFVVMQAYTANLSSILTVDQLQPIERRVIQSIGYQEGSFVRDLLVKKYDSNVSLKPYTTINQYHDALKNKSVDVIYDELPYINLFLNKHGSDYMKVGPIYKSTGFGFAFPFGYPYVPEFSRAVVSVSESKKMQELMKKYHVHEYSSDDQASQVPLQTPPLRAHSFIGLFILTGVGTIGAVLASEYALWQRRSATAEMTNDSEDLLNVDNQEHPPPVSIPSDGEISIKESDEGEENAEVFPSQVVPH